MTPAGSFLVAAGHAFASFGTLLVRPDLPSPTWPQGVLGVACVAAVLAWGMFLRARRQLARSRREQAAAELRLRVARARQLERNRIAGEMHDVLAHRLSLLSLHAGALELWPDAPPGEVAPRRRGGPRLRPPRAGGPARRARRAPRRPGRRRPGRRGAASAPANPSQPWPTCRAGAGPARRSAASCS
jgi:hypothetical protein